MKEKITNFENFHFEPEWIVPWEDLQEKVYIENIFENLRITLQHKFSDYLFVYYASDSIQNPPKPIVITDSRPKILIWSGDQRAETPMYMTKYFKAIFKTHLNGDTDKPGYYHLPLGYTKNVVIDNIKPILERDNNVFYSGNYNYNRVSLLKAFSGLKFLPDNILHRLYRKNVIKNDFSNSFPSSYIKFTGGFAQGLDGKTYSEYLNNSKIVICPPGFHRNETFRHYEALKAGAIPISLPLPDNYFYRGAPFVIIKSWQELNFTVSSLLNNPQKMLELQEKSVYWWKNVCSEKAVAQYMAKIILQ